MTCSLQRHGVAAVLTSSQATVSGVSMLSAAEMVGKVTRMNGEKTDKYNKPGEALIVLVAFVVCHGRPRRRDHSARATAEPARWPQKFAGQRFHWSRIAMSLTQIACAMWSERKQFSVSWKVELSSLAGRLSFTSQSAWSA